ncbi:hypothetical protein BPAE_0045g00080 [Botrytis paeoniae]|uniref:Uncharacterized protein n=1 Tax=Botrytis paeoniae TaxID=278948 RepID=A0A4Z1FZL2_9HELO|nr:hypothetical protein BPAE_0045g00080 [Botrytis paeoniae]
MLARNAATVEDKWLQWYHAPRHDAARDRLRNNDTVIRWSSNPQVGGTSVSSRKRDRAVTKTIWGEDNMMEDKTIAMLEDSGFIPSAISCSVASREYMAMDLFFEFVIEGKARQSYVWNLEKEV